MISSIGLMRKNLLKTTTILILILAIIVNIEKTDMRNIMGLTHKTNWAIAMMI